MVSELEKEELGRLTHQKLRALKQTQEKPSGRVTQQEIQLLKRSERKSDTGEVKIKVFLERMFMAVGSGVGAVFSTGDRRKVDPCAEYGHNLPFGTQWKGPFPKCLDCKVEIKDPASLRGSMNKVEQNKFKSI